MRRPVRGGTLGKPSTGSKGHNTGGRLSRRQRWLLGGVSALLFALAYTPFIAAPVRPTLPPELAAADLAQFWRPTEIESADLLHGPWGAELAPDPAATYTFLELKTSGHSPGMTVRDPGGLEWSVKQGAEGPVEPTVSRLLSAMGYHQPPVYYLPSFTVSRDGRIEKVEGGRFRPKLPGLNQEGSWSWQQNPFVGTQPYQGLLVLLMILNSSDLKNANNSIYELSEPRAGATRWYVVKDLGASLGASGRLDPPRGDPDLFERTPFIAGVRDRFVTFHYVGWHQELVRGRITTSDVRWMCERLGRLSAQQWADAFRAGGHEPGTAERFIRRIRSKVKEGAALPD